MAFDPTTYAAAKTAGNVVSLTLTADRMNVLDKVTLTTNNPSSVDIFSLRILQRQLSDALLAQQTNLNNLSMLQISQDPTNSQANLQAAIALAQTNVDNKNSAISSLQSLILDTLSSGASN